MPPAADDTACDVSIRPYTVSDWTAVCRIHDAARPQELATGGVDARAFRPMVEAAEGDEFFASETAVACVGDTIAGFISWNGAYITWLYVDPAFQRRGIGRRLLQHALRLIGPEAWTSMIVGNEAALGLYRGAGMEMVWTRSSQCDGYACNSMRLALPTSRMHDPAARRQSPTA
jgi:ribosomal protein S18 acetylase RimI-like enzyme